MKVKVLRDTHIRSMHEMGEMKRAEEIRVDEVSVQKLREIHETIQQLTSQWQKMQEQMNSMGDPGEFQEVESNYSAIVLRFQSACNDSKFSFHGEPRQRLLLDTWNTSGLQENFFLVINVLRLIHTEIIIKGIHPCAPQREWRSIPQATRTGTLFARDDKQNRDTIPMPTFARRPSSVSSLIPVEFPQNSMVGLQRQQISELQFDKFFNPQSFLVWKIRFKNQVITCSDFPSEAMLWIKEVELVDSLEELMSSRFVSGTNFPNFEVLDAKIASALNKIIQNSQFKKVSLEEQKAQKEDRFWRGRQFSFMINDYFLVIGGHDTVLDYADFFSVTLHHDNIQEFDTRWDEVLLSVSKIPSDDVLESLCKLRIRESAQLKNVLELYDMEIHQKTSVLDYQKLKTIVKRSIDQELRVRNFDVRHGRIETGAVVKNRKGMSSVEGGEKVLLTSGKKKGQCSKGDHCSFRHQSDDRAQKPENTLSPHIPSQPSQEVEVCRRREVSKTKVTMVPFFDNRADILWKVFARERLVNIGILPTVNFTKQKRDAKPEISACSRIIRLMNNQTNGQRKVIIHTTEEKATSRMLWLLWKLYHNRVASQDSDALVSQRGKRSWGNPMQKVLESIRKVRFSTPRQASIQEKKRPSLGKVQVKNPHQRSPYAMKFEDRSHEETERQQRYVPEARHGLCQKHFQALRLRPSYILFAHGRMGVPGCINKRTRGRRVCGGFRSLYACGQQARP